MRVLLLCSHAKARSRLAYAMRFEGAAVMEAVRPKKLVELARSAPPDLVILDDPRAEHLAGELRALPDFAQLPIVVGMEVVRPCSHATHVWPSPIEVARAVALVRERHEQFAKVSPPRHSA